MNTIVEALNAIQALREWVKAVPQDTPLPAMPGVDGDWLDAVEAALAQEPAQPIGFTWIDFHRELQGAQWAAVTPGWTQALEMVCKRLLEIDAAQQDAARTAQVGNPDFKAACDEWIEKTAWVRKTIKPSELGKHIADVLRERIQVLQAKPKIDVPNAFVDFNPEAEWIVSVEHLNCPACGGSGHVDDVAKVSQIRQTAIDLYKPPFNFIRGYIFDADNQMIADDQGQDTVARVRGWGRIQKMPNASAVQDEVGQMIADALNAYYACRPSN